MSRERALSDRIATLTAENTKLKKELGLWRQAAELNLRLVLHYENQFAMRGIQVLPPINKEEAK